MLIYAILIVLAIVAFYWFFGTENLWGLGEKFVQRVIYMPSHAAHVGHRCHPGLTACDSNYMKCPPGYMEEDQTSLGRKCKEMPWHLNPLYYANN